MKHVRINQIAFLAVFAVLFPAFGRVYYFSGNGATNERGYLISDKANWQDLASMPPADSDILGLRNVSGKTCVLSLNADLTIGRWSVEDNNGKNLAFDFSPYTFEATGVCSGGSNQGNLLTLKSGVLKCVTLNVPHSGAMRDNVFIAKGVNSSVLVKTFGMTKGTNNVFCVCDGAAFGNYRDASQDLKLFNDASIESYRNVFCVSNATVRNYKTIQLNGGRENTVRLENVTFLDLSNAAMTPGFSFADGQNNVLELIRQDVVVESNADLAIFGNNTIGCKVQIAGGASLMHTNWNKQVQVGANSTTAISNFVHVTGAGSTLGYNGAIILGKHYAPYSGLLVEDGGVVKYVQSSGGGGGTTYIGQGASHGNWVRVEGAGSVFAPANVTMGCGDKADTTLGVAYGNENKLTISRGATATVSALQVGFFNSLSFFLRPAGRQCRYCHKSCKCFFHIASS